MKWRCQLEWTHWRERNDSSRCRLIILCTARGVRCSLIMEQLDPHWWHCNWQVAGDRVSGVHESERSRTRRAQWSSEQRALWECASRARLDWRGPAPRLCAAPEDGACAYRTSIGANTRSQIAAIEQCERAVRHLSTHRARALHARLANRTEPNRTARTQCCEPNRTEYVNNACLNRALNCIYRYSGAHREARRGAGAARVARTEAAAAALNKQRSARTQ